MTTRATTVFDWVRSAALAAGVVLLGCASGGGASGETHFLCAATPDCDVHGAGYACVHGACQREMGAGGASTGGVPVTAGPDSSVGPGIADGGAGNGGTGGAAGTPAQGAVTLKISPTPGQTCQHTNGQVSEPAAETTGVVGELLGCDLTQACQPDQFVVVDRDRGTNIQCNISPNGNAFNVAIQMNVSSDPSMQFGASGTLGPTGGTLSITENNSVAGGGGVDNGCIVTITPNSGVIAKGKIWAQFECDQFRDPNDLADTGCRVQGAFLFENCGG